MKECFVRCSVCGRQVSTLVYSRLKEGIIVRAWVECEDCIDSFNEGRNLINFLRRVLRRIRVKR